MAADFSKYFFYTKIPASSPLKHTLYLIKHQHSGCMLFIAVHFCQYCLLCDGGGSNSSSHHIFKQSLIQLARRIEMNIIVYHYPPYCPKWNTGCLLIYQEAGAVIRFSASNRQERKRKKQPLQRDCLSMPTLTIKPTIRKCISASRMNCSDKSISYSMTYYLSGITL